jgi:hypothetical protein
VVNYITPHSRHPYSYARINDYRQPDRKGVDFSDIPDWYMAPSLATMPGLHFALMIRKTLVFSKLDYQQ